MWWSHFHRYFFEGPRTIEVIRPLRAICNQLDLKLEFLSVGKRMLYLRFDGLRRYSLSNALSKYIFWVWATTFFGATLAVQYDRLDAQQKDPQVDPAGPA